MGENWLIRLPEALSQLVAFALAISVHESAHAWTADRCGDPTGRLLGRVSLNPLRHLDPVGTLAFPLLLAVVGAPVFGWAKPVPVVPHNFRQVRRCSALVAAAGPAANVGLALGGLAVLLALQVGVPDGEARLLGVLRDGAAGTGGVAAPLLYLVFAFTFVNLVLAVFNLLPIPPADGSHLLAAALPPAVAGPYARLGRYGILVFLLLLWTGAWSWLFRPLAGALTWVLLR